MKVCELDVEVVKNENKRIVIAGRGCKKTNATWLILPVVYACLKD